MSQLESRLRTALAAEATLWPEPDSVSSRVLPSSGKRRLLVAVAVLAAVSVAATWLLTRDVTNPTAVVCYEEVSLDSDRAAAATGGDLDPSLCAAEWESGPLVNEDIVDKGEVPPLVGCVTDQGVLAVFPTYDQGICEELGLAQPNPGSFSEGNDIRQLQEDLIDHFSEQACQPMLAAEVDVREILDSSGFEDWQIRVGSSRPDRPCASHAVDPESKTIHLVPIPRL